MRKSLFDSHFLGLEEAEEEEEEDDFYASSESAEAEGNSSFSLPGHQSHPSLALLVVVGRFLSVFLKRAWLLIKSRDTRSSKYTLALLFCFA